MTNTQTLTGIFDDIADAVRAKDGTNTTMTPAQMPARIAAIPDAFDWSQIKCGIAIKQTVLQTALDLRKMDVSSFTNFNSTFSGCRSLLTLDVSNWNTSNVTAMGETFNGCSGLTSLNLASWNTANVTNMYHLFYGCAGLTSLNLQSFTTSSVTNTTGMILGCTNITDVIWAINSTTVQPIVNATSFDKVANTVPTDLNVWVRPSLLASYQSNTNWTRYSSCFKSVANLPQALQTLYGIDPTLYP